MDESCAVENIYNKYCKANTKYYINIFLNMQPVAVTGPLAPSVGITAGSRGAAAPLACSPRKNGGAGGAVLKNK